MKSKSALITGGTSGIGLSIVKHLITENYNVYFIGTNVDKGKAIETELSKRSNNQVTFIKLDLSNLNEVYRFTKEFRQKLEHLDLLANIAGALIPEKIITEEGVEKNLAISYLSSYILSLELVPLLKKALGSRIINVGAKPTVVLKETLNFDDLNMENNYSAYKASGYAVHAKTVLTQILSEKLREDSILVNSFDPGMVKSGLMRAMPTIVRTISSLFFLFASKESQTGKDVCTSHGKFNSTGKLFFGEKVLEIHFQESYKNKLLKNTENLLSNILEKREPNYKLDWIIPQKLAGLTHFHSGVSFEDIQQVYKQAESLIQSVDKEFNIIIDNRLMLMERMFTLEELQKQAPFLTSKFLKYILIIKPDHLNLSSLDFNLQETNGIYLKNVSTVDEAFDFLSGSCEITKDDLMGIDFF